ncbi:hypothetical protein [Allostreptomyces psammosilenae]|uniref:Uncharacterized protein n=1 Tax=Allostreptomyces psammosilenae TaxID=1892865 RepID=A0A852ZZ90_9ACTN|nr:hypothetical protein [Allostreptomyces psammosilenae]NYI03592.1 hypothetical protein [Allostreptomyces psammosilenae]
MSDDEDIRDQHTGEHVPEEQAYDLGGTDLVAGDDSGAAERRIRAEHHLDPPEEFDQEQGVPERARTRAAGLLPEERLAPGDDPLALAAEVLHESDVRTEVPGAAPDTVIERRGSAE